MKGEICLDLMLGAAEKKYASTPVGAEKSNLREGVVQIICNSRTDIVLDRCESNIENGIIDPRLYSYKGNG